MVENYTKGNDGHCLTSTCRNIHTYRMTEYVSENAMRNIGRQKDKERFERKKRELKKTTYVTVEKIKPLLLGITDTFPIRIISAFNKAPALEAMHWPAIYFFYNYTEENRN